MPHELPAAVASGLGDARIVLADAGVDRERRRDAVAVERRLDPPEAYAVAILVPGPVREIRQHGDSGRRRQYLTRHRPADVPHLDIDDGPDDQPYTFRQLERGSIDDGGIRQALAGFHAVPLLLFAV